MCETYYRYFTHVLQVYELQVQYSKNTTHVLHIHYTCNVHVAHLLVIFLSVFLPELSLTMGCGESYCIVASAQKVCGFPGTNTENSPELNYQWL